MWQAQYKPRYDLVHEVFQYIPDDYDFRNHIPWIIIGICYVCCMALLLIIRFILSSENKRRDQEPPDETYDDVYIDRIGKDGEVHKVKVEKVRLTLQAPRHMYDADPASIGILRSNRHTKS